MLKEDLSAALAQAQREKDVVAVSALRLALAAVKDLEIDARGREGGLAPGEPLALLRRMVRQRAEAAAMYREGKRPELAEREEREGRILQGFLPEELSEGELGEVLDELIRETSAASLKDMSRVMAGLKEQYAGRADLRKASELLRRRLGA